MVNKMLLKKKFLLVIIALLLLIIATQWKIMISVRDNRQENASALTTIVDEIKSKSPLKAKEAYSIADVPHIMQRPELDRGCEVTSLAMLLQFYGFDVTKMSLADEIDKVPFEEGNYRGDMREGFVGNMETFNESGIGVYIDPIEKLAKKYAKGKVISLEGKDISSIYKQVAKGRPVWVITNAEFKKLPESAFTTWNTKNGELKITYSMHSVVITGYDKDYVYVNDPLAQLPNTKLAKKDFEEAWVQMGSQALTIKK